MPRNYFANNDVVTIDLGEGDWIKIKDELTYGEDGKNKNSALDVVVNSDGVAVSNINMIKYNINKYVSYIKEWSVTYPDGSPAPVSAEVMSDMSPEFIALIENALNEHAVKKEALKKASTDGEPGKETK